MERIKIKVGITQGDINGTSYEIMLKTFQEQRFNEICTPVIYGSPKIAAYYRKALNINNFSFYSIANVDEAADRKANLINVLDDNAKVELGDGTTMLCLPSVPVNSNANIPSWYDIHCHP